MTVAPYNHQSLQAEYGIKILSQILTKHLTGQGQMWHKYLPLATSLITYLILLIWLIILLMSCIWEKTKITVRLGDGSRCESIKDT